jgi:hypothetical protein
MREPWDGDPGPGFRYVFRKLDALVHAVREPTEAMHSRLSAMGFKINDKGAVINDNDAHLIATKCGLRVKMNAGARNRYTEQAVTCLVCVIGGYR